MTTYTDFRRPSSAGHIPKKDGPPSAADNDRPLTHLATRTQVLVITRNLPPLVGGMERLVWHIVDELRADYRVHIVGPLGSKLRLPPDVTISEVPLKPLPWFLLRTLLATLSSVLRLRPCMVLAGSGTTAPFAWLAARLTGARCIVYLHGADIDTGRVFYRLLWRPFFRRFDRVLVNSQFTRQLTINAGVPPGCIAILHPGVELPSLGNVPKQRAAFRKRYGLGDAPLMLYVGRIIARKGLTVFAREMLPEIVAKQPNVWLVVIGDERIYTPHHKGGERQRVMEALKIHELSNKVIFLSGINDANLRAAYFAADVLVFPVQERLNDHEGFGMVAAEAAAHGLPTIAFAAGGVPDAVADGLSGRLVPAGDNQAFVQAVLQELATSDLKRGRTCRTFAEGLAWPSFGNRLRQFVCAIENTPS